MNLEEIYFLTQIGVGVAVIISIIFVGLELRQNSFLMCKSMGNDRRHLTWCPEYVDRLNEFNYWLRNWKG